ncbi:hypothetical protein WK03_35720 [Burkholderia cepacia]|nr:hypothetical protein WK03_35720 [Burkholderia cepacia]
MLILDIFGMIESVEASSSLADSAIGVPWRGARRYKKISRERVFNMTMRPTRSTFLYGERTTCMA